MTYYVPVFLRLPDSSSMTLEMDKAIELMYMGLY